MHRFLLLMQVVLCFEVLIFFLILAYFTKVARVKWFVLVMCADLYILRWWSVVPSAGLGKNTSMIHEWQRSSCFPCLESGLLNY